MTIRNDGVFQGVVLIDEDGNPIVFGDPTAVVLDIRKVGDVVVGDLGDTLVLADTPAAPANSLAYFKDGAGNAKAVSAANPFPVVFDGGSGDVNILTFAGEEFDAHQAMDYGQPLLQTGSLVYGWDEDGNQGLAVGAVDLNGVIYNLDSRALVGIGVVAGYDPTFASIQGVTTNQGIGDSYYPIGLDTNQAYLGGTVLANQSGAPGWMPSALGGLDGNGDMQPIFAVTPGGWFASPGTVDDGFGIVGVMSLDAVGGVATYPAFNPHGGLDNSTSPTVGGVAAIGMAYTSNGDYYDHLTLSQASDGLVASDKNALDTSLIFWGLGGTAVSAAFDLGDFSGDASGIFAPRVYSVLAAYDDGDASGVSGLTNTYDPVADKTSLDVTIQGNDAFATSGEVDAPTIITIGSGKILQNFTVNAIWTGSPTADTFTATLEGSFLGTYTGSDKVVLRTLNAGDLADGISGVPYPYSRLNLSAISLVTATKLTITGVGSK